MQHVMTGKVKEVYLVDDETLEFAYTDNISVFDKIIPSKIPHKGETLCRTAKHWFELLNAEGIRNHYIDEPAPDRMRVKRVDIIRDYSRIDGSTVGYLIPLEVICRHYVAGSLMDRIEAGMMGLNVGVLSNAAAPFGGVKMSGMGKEGSFEGIEEYLNTKYTAFPEPHTDK